MPRRRARSRPPGFATPIARPLVGVQAREDQDASASQVFEGSIAVRQGDTPAMAFVIGTDLLFDNGWVRVHEGSSTWIGPSEPGASGTVEFRYAPAAMLRLLGRLDEPHARRLIGDRSDRSTERAPARIAGWRASSSCCRSCRSPRATSSPSRDWPLHVTLVEPFQTALPADDVARAARPRRGHRSGRAGHPRRRRRRGHVRATSRRAGHARARRRRARRAPRPHARGARARRHRPCSRGSTSART